MTKKAFVFSAGTRALAFRLQAVVLAVVVFWVVQGPLAPARAEGRYEMQARDLVANPPDGAAISEEAERAVLLAVNAYRKSKGRPALALADDTLLFAARAHAMDLLAMGQVGHVSSGGYSFESRIRSLRGGGMLILPAMAENAARDRRHGVSLSEKAQAILQQWIDSPRHRKSLTDRSFVAVATGAARKGDAIYVVQIFVGPETKNNLFN